MADCWIKDPKIIGGSIAIATLIGFFLGESIRLIRVLGLLLVIIGLGILASFSA